MTFSTDDIFQAAFDLPREDRKFLADRLLETLDGKDDSEVRRKWQEEVDRRVKSIEDGTAKLIPAEEVFDSLRKRVHP